MQKSSVVYHSDIICTSSMTTAQSWLLKDLVQTSSIRFVRRDSGWQYTKQKCPELMSSSETDIFNNDGSSLSWHWSLSLSLLCSFSYACLLLPSKSTQQAFIPFALKCWTWSSIIEFNEWQQLKYKTFSKTRR